MRRRMRVVCLIGLGLLQACASGPTAEDIAAMRHASQQWQAQRQQRLRAQVHASIAATSLPANYQHLIDAHFVATLKDPDSRTIEYGRNPYGSLVCGTVNARNAYGGYTGKHPFHASFTAEGTLAEVEVYSPNALKAARELKRQQMPLTSEELVKEAMVLEDCDLL